MRRQSRSFTGVRGFGTYDVAELVPYIDWTPFFQTWEFKGRYPAHAGRPRARRGGAGPVRRCSGDAEAHRRRALVHAQGSDRLLAGQCDRRRHRAVCRRVARGAAGDAVHTLRQQLARRDGRPNVALADFIAPAESGKADYIGAFVVTAGARAKKRSPSASRRPMTIIARSW